MRTQFYQISFPVFQYFTNNPYLWVVHKNSSLQFSARNVDGPMDFGETALAISADPSGTKPLNELFVWRE